MRYPAADDGESDMGDTGCEDCSLRARYDAEPRSLLGRIWRWHTRFCPGWKRYMSSLSIEQRRRLIERYRLPARLEKRR